MLRLLALLLAFAAAPLEAKLLVAAPETVDDGWRSTSPDAAGFDETALMALDASITSGGYGNVHALLIERGGELVFERYYSGPDRSGSRSLGTVRFGRTSLHDIRSAGKTIAALLTGIAIEEGHIPSLDVPLFELLPHRAELLSGGKREITLRHVLSMSAGLAWDEATVPYGSPGNDDHDYRLADDPIGFALSRPLVHSPGESFSYSSALTQTIVEVLETTTGRQVEDYAEEKLFAPMRIRDVVWAWQIGDAPEIGAALRLNSRDLAKFGRLMVDRGAWNGRQLVPAPFTDEMVYPQVEVVEDAAHASGGLAKNVKYGLFTWLPSLTTPNGDVLVPELAGNGEQRVILMRQRDLVVTILAGNYVGGGTEPDPWMPERMLIQVILPALAPNH